MGARFGLEGGRKRWCTGIFENLENSAPEPGLEVQSRQRRLQRPQAPTSLLMLSVPLRLYSSACSFTSVRGCSASLVISDFPIFPPPVPRDVALEPAQGKLSPLCARGGREEQCRSRTPLPRLPASARYSRARTQGVGERAVQLSSRSSMRRRWCEALICMRAACCTWRSTTSPRAPSRNSWARL